MNESNSHARVMLRLLAEKADEYAGLPCPLEGMPMVIHPRYRFAAVFNDRPAQEAPENPEPELTVVNEWFSRRKSKLVTIVRETKTGKLLGFYSPLQSPINAALRTLGALGAWNLACEARAMDKLHNLVSRHAYISYAMTGSFLETSKRSRLTYLFRRLRPTVVIDARPGDRDKEASVLCALCLHPIGYYENTWAGAMVPTDEIIAHLLLMRGDEHRFWKHANQIPRWNPASAL